MEESDSEEELPLLEMSKRSSLSSLGDSLPRAAADITIQQAKQHRQLQTRNVITLSCVSMLLATAAPLQYAYLDVIFPASATNIRDTSLVIQMTLLTSFTLAGIVTPILVAYLGVTNVLILGSFTTSLYCCVSFIPHLVTLVPLAIVAGLFLHATYSSYFLSLTQASFLYLGTYFAHLGNSLEDLSQFFSGAFHTFLLAGPAWRSVLELLVLEHRSTENVWNCTPEYCSWKTNSFYITKLSNSTSILPVYKTHRVQVLLGLMVMLSGAALFIITLCLSLKHRIERRILTTACGLFTKSAVKMCNVEFILLIPTMLFIGLEETVLYQMLGKSYAPCIANSWLSQQYFIIFASGASMVASLPLAVLATFVGRIKTTVVAHFLLTSLLVTVIIWQPLNDNMAPLFLIGGFWGAADAVLRTQLFLMLKRYLEHHCVSAAACSNSMMSAGMLMTLLLLHEHVCVELVLLVCLGCSLISILAYTTFEIRRGLQSQQVSRTSSFTLPDLDNPSWIPTLDPLSTGPRSSLFAKLY